MILQIKDNLVIEAIRHNTDQDMENHFINDCGWTKDQFSKIESNDFYDVEIKATNDSLKTSSAFLGSCCSDNFEDDIKTGLGGYLPQLISEVVDSLDQ